MIVSFKERATEDIFNGNLSKTTNKICPPSILKIATRKLDQLDYVKSLSELKVPPGNRLERLSGNRKGQHSIRINDQFCICFRWVKTEPDKVEITDYHRGAL